jgi:2-polyprenyl-3-methyl-5-hydroxy-6-metoxy-1,4-benzoquinol methylase
MLETGETSAGSAGYVPLQRNPYRGHMLLADAVLRHTNTGDRVFEGGVSTGYFARVLVDAGRIVDGADIDAEAADEARRVCDQVVVGDLQHLAVGQLAERYQALVFGDTLEHLPDPAALLRRLSDLLDGSGVLVTSIPNVANWAIRLGLLFGRFRYTDRGILDRTHLRFYTMRTASDMLAEGGFEVTECTATVPVPYVSSPTVSRIAHVIGNRWPSLFAYTFVIVARKVSPPRR